MENLKIVELIDKAKQNDENALEELYTSFYEDVYFTCIKLLGNKADSEDITQDTFIEAFRNLTTLKPPYNLKSWLCRIAANKSINFLKRTDKFVFTDNDELDETVFFDDGGVTLEDRIIDGDVGNTISEIIMRLPQEQRSVLFLFYYQQFTVKEIAEIIGCSENTVKSRLRYARSFMKKEIEKLEDNGYKLRCIAALPFVTAIFMMQRGLISVAPAVGYSQIAAAAAGTAAATAGGIAAGAAMNTAAGAAAGTAGGIAAGAAMNTAAGAAAGTAGGIAAGAAMNTAAGTAAGTAGGIAAGAAMNTAAGTAAGTAGGVAAGAAMNTAAGAAADTAGGIAAGAAMDTAAGTAASTAGNAAVSAAVHTAANATAGVASKAAGVTAAKIVIGCIAAAAVCAGTVAIVYTVQNREPENPAVQESVQVSVEASGEASDIPSNEPVEEPTDEKKTESEDFYGYTVETDEGLYYSKHSSSDPEGSIRGVGHGISVESIDGTSHEKQMICRGADGTEKELFEEPITGKFAICSGKFFYNTDEGILCSRDMNGGNVSELGKMKLDYVTEDGGYLICSVEEAENREIYDICVLNTVTEEKQTVVESGKYIGYHDGRIYYSLQSSDGSQLYQLNGQIKFQSVNVDGTDDRVLFTQDENFVVDFSGPTAAIHPTQAAQIYFGEEYIYLSFGVYDLPIIGSNYYYYGGRIVKIKYDGSSSEVVAGETDLVGPEFFVNEDGSVTVHESEVIWYEPLKDTWIEYKSVYMIDPDTGSAMKMLSPEDYSIIGEEPDEEVNCYSISEAELIGDKLYYFVEYAEKTGNGFQGRDLVQTKAFGFFEKDMTTGEVKALYQS